MKTFGKRSSGLRLERLQDSPLWADGAFRNIHPVLPGLRDTGAPQPTIADFLCGGERRLPRAPLPPHDPRPAWARPPVSGLRATWIGHSKVLIEIDGHRVLTDPVGGPRASPLRLAGPKVAKPPGAPHRLDGHRRTFAALLRPQPERPQRHAVVVAGGARRAARGVLQRRTGLTSEYATIRERLGSFDLAMLEVGVFHPSWGDIHLGPAHALQALDLLGGPPLLPIHWGTFARALHAWDEPAETLLALAPQHGARLVMPPLGEVVEPVFVERVTPWWRTVEGSAGSVQPTPAPQEEAPLPATVPWPLD